MKKDRRQHAAPSGGKWKSLLQRCGGERVFVAAFLVLALAAGFLGTILLPKQEFSENENRMLETLDAVDFDSLISGSTMDNIENYMCDHFPLRSFFISLNTEVNLAMGKKDSGGNYSARPAEGGVYFGKNGHLYEVLLDDQTRLFLVAVYVPGRGHRVGVLLLYRHYSGVRGAGGHVRRRPAL